MSDMSVSGSKVSRPDSEGTLGARIVAADRSTLPRGKARVLVGGGAFVLVSSTLSAPAGESASVSGDCLRRLQGPERNETELELSAESVRSRV